MARRIWNPRQLRAGFTLVELLVVIVIIGLLMALGLYGATRVMRQASITRAMTEISQLSAAMEGLKIGRLYPPCMGAITNSSPVFQKASMIDRGDSIDAYLALWKPRSVQNYGYLKSNLGGGSLAYTYLTAAGRVATLNIQSLDQAEAMVFWLGGMPTPCKPDGTLRAPSKLCGFNGDPTTPFSLDTASYSSTDPLAFMRNRTPGKFNFVEDRLTDVDGDGWLEYAPTFASSGGTTPPYVYFDASSTYSRWTSAAASCNIYSYPSTDSYPPNAKSVPTVAAAYQALQDQWGVAFPYASNLGTGGQINWRNPTSFQVICCGPDGRYGPSAVSNRSGGFDRLVLVDTGPGRQAGFMLGGSTGVPFLAADEEDNLTNFTNGTIFDLVQSQ